MLPLYWLASLALPIVVAVAEANHDGQDAYIVEFMDRVSRQNLDAMSHPAERHLDTTNGPDLGP